jgi:hypothetical protein
MVEGGRASLELGRWRKRGWNGWEGMVWRWRSCSEGLLKGCIGT